MGRYPDLRDGALFKRIVQLREAKSAGHAYTKPAYFPLLWWIREKAILLVKRAVFGLYIPHLS